MQKILFQLYHLKFWTDLLNKSSLPQSRIIFLIDAISISLNTFHVNISVFIFKKHYLSSISNSSLLFKLLVWQIILIVDNRQLNLIRNF